MRTSPPGRCRLFLAHSGAFSARSITQSSMCRSVQRFPIAKEYNQGVSDRKASEHWTPHKRNNIALLCALHLDGAESTHAGLRVCVKSSVHTYSPMFYILTMNIKKLHQFLTLYNNCCNTQSDITEKNYRSYCTGIPRSVLPRRSKLITRQAVSLQSPSFLATHSLSPLSVWLICWFHNHHGHTASGAYL